MMMMMIMMMMMMMMIVMMKTQFMTSCFPRVSVLHDYPTHVEVWQHSAHSIEVRWREVATHALEESVMGYIVSFRYSP